MNERYVKYLEAITAPADFLAEKGKILDLLKGEKEKPAEEQPETTEEQPEEEVKEETKEGE